MLRRISKSGTFIQFSIFAVILAVMWIPAFVNPLLPVQTSSDGPLFTLLANWLQNNALLSVALALTLVILQSFILFYVFQANGFFKRSNFLPAIIILLAYSWNGDFQTMHAVIPATLFIIIALNSIMGMYGKQGAYQDVFIAAFSIGLASLFYIPLAFLLLMIWFTLITYRISSWREYAVSVIGYILPFIYYVSWLFWNDNVRNGLNQLSGSLINLILPPRISIISTIWLSASAFIMIVAMFAVLNVMNDKLISLRRRSWVLFNFSFTVLVAILIAGWPILSANYLFVIPLSFFLTGSFSLIKRSFWFEMLALAYLLLLICIRVYVVFPVIGYWLGLKV
jgi:hypothetical protein